MTFSRQIGCACGTVRLRIDGEPLAAALCHCESCRLFYGTPVFAATAWDAAHVSVDAGDDALGVHAHPTRQLRRHFCRACGDAVFGTNRLGMRVVPNTLFMRAHGGVLPAALRPTMHLYYRYRVVDIDDALPKFLEGWDGPLHGAPAAAP
ncbi:GFA family protein [Burkholderia alba]|uniref:GFA family protein n=1 Tax=Burkholderia alba TaxID=2683677 RepID=UPI002B051ACB|nr:GFA family protein [Burkholderia alba]